MATAKTWKSGHLHQIDDIPNGDPDVAGALTTYANSINKNRQSRHWIRAVQWIENILFGVGRHYVDDILVSRLSRDSQNESTVARDIARRTPRPVNDLLGRYIETNIALLTENRPRPRVTAKSDRREDRLAAELSEYTMEYLWEDLGQPEMHREIARVLLYCGVCWLEVIYDPTEPRHMTVPQTTSEQAMIIPGQGAPISLPVDRQVEMLDSKGRPKLVTKLEYGDITAKLISPFEMHVPVAHSWTDDNVSWVMREYYAPIDVLKDRYLNNNLKKSVITKRNGWTVGNIESIAPYNIQNLPLWWWERMSDVVEGPGPTLYVGTPEQWDDYAVARVFDRKPNPKWPNGRTILVVGDQVIYDSPKNRGARAYDPRWPKRWHPYTRYRWEAQIGSIYGRSLVAKLLPKIKRVDSIDTTLIMWRRVVPMGTWIMPKGTSPVEDLHSGRPGAYIEYDVMRTRGAKPEPVYPPEYPATALEERATQIKEMEAMAGTEEILRGQRPTGVTSAAMLDVMRKQALASRSAILQSWDESLETTGGAFLQETAKHIKDDPRYSERIRILAREKASRFSIERFSGMDLSDNVRVRVDTASMAMVSQEAKQSRAIEVMQYAPGLMTLPAPLRAKLVQDLGWDDALTPQGRDIMRAQTLISFIRGDRMDIAVPFPEDNPYVIHEFMVDEMMKEGFMDWPQPQQQKLLELIQHYRDEIIHIEEAQMEMSAMTSAMGAEIEAAPAAAPPAGPAGG